MANRLYTVYDSTGRCLMSMDMPDLENAQLNVETGQILVEGEYGADIWYDGSAVAIRPVIPAPVWTEQGLVFPDDIPSLVVRVLEDEYGRSVVASGPGETHGTLWFRTRGGFRIEAEADFS